MLNLPNTLTLSRIVMIPVIIAAFYLPAPAAHWATFLIFLAAGVTDYFDGYFARARNQFSAFGRFLDPIADKLLVTAIILMMVAMKRIEGIHVLAAMVILCREMFISGLREFLAGVHVGVPVSLLAKWKTATQFAALGLLLVGDAASFVAAREIGLVALWVATALTLWTGYDYWRASLRHMRPPKAEAAE